jgi:hypothetical protein
MEKTNPTPGKFETSGPKGELFYAMTMDGVDGESGDVTETGMWAGLLKGPFFLGQLHEDYPKEYALLTEDDKDEIAKAKGAIVTEDDKGFVELDLFTNGAEMSRAWDDLAADLDGEEVEGEEAPVEAEGN